MRSSAFRILLLESRDEVSQQLKSDLTEADFLLEGINSPGELWSHLAEDVAVLLISVFVLKQLPSSTLSEVRKEFPHTQIILLNSAEERNASLSFLRDGALWHIAVPYEREELVELVARGCVLHELSEQNTSLRSTLSESPGLTEFLGESDAIKEVLEKVSRLASMNSTVLITGESGSGKTTLARLIHQNSQRQNAQFIGRSCASIPRTLLESELFGHEKGAFTGAHARRYGSAELADGGTLFLDEIGDLPLELQPKLLTFLEEQSFQRVGSSENIKVDVRIIAATNLDLEDLCEQGRFRSELYYRIGVLTLRAPALREMGPDIELLADRILRRISKERALPNCSLTAEARELMRSYHWPGNVRELENVLEQASAFASGYVLDAPELPIKTLGKSSSSKLPAGTLAGISLEELERQAIVDTLASCEGSKPETAKRLGISLKSIYNKMAKYGL